jgi:hypothetical protein
MRVINLWVHLHINEDWAEEIKETLPKQQEHENVSHGDDCQMPEGNHLKLPKDNVLIFGDLIKF